MDLYQIALVILGSAVAVLFAIVYDMRARRRNMETELASLRNGFAWLVAREAGDSGTPAPVLHGRAPRPADADGDSTTFYTSERAPSSRSVVREDAAPPSSGTLVSPTPGGAAPRGKARRNP